MQLFYFLEIITKQKKKKVSVFVIILLDLYLEAT